MAGAKKRVEFELYFLKKTIQIKCFEEKGVHC